MIPSTLSVAFKEWAVICEALANYRQCVILRKGGISEEGGEFRPEHSEFLLYPTYYHEHKTEVKPDFQDVFAETEAASPAPGTIELLHFVQVTDVQYVTELKKALALEPLHAWTADVINQRFHYRTPGLFILTVRVFQLPTVEYRVEKPEYAGCKTWVTLDSPVSTEGAVPVLSDEEFSVRTDKLKRILHA
jgi:hypothetical protein